MPAGVRIFIVSNGRRGCWRSFSETDMSKQRSKSAVSEAQAYWQAVKERDRRFDGTFFYSVATTGVYCRPSCPSRLAKRENVRFHPTCRAAEAAGYRPCRRCKPNERPLLEIYVGKVADACRTIETAECTPTLDQLAHAADLSRFHFHRVFKAIVGLTPKGYAEAHRQVRMRDTLQCSQTVTGGILEAGFGSSGRFYARASEMLGMTPTAFRNGGADTALRFAVGECSLGAVLVAQSSKGIAAILLGDDADALVRDFQDRFSNADLVGGDPAFERVVAQVIGFVEMPALGLDLPLDIRGTAFQHRVWCALKDIPAGSTATYSDVAQRIGMPKAVRAVARACAANTIAVAIPCHRVVRSDGSLAGYRWGIDRKRALLTREAFRKCERRR